MKESSQQEKNKPQQNQPERMRERMEETADRGMKLGQEAQEQGERAMRAGAENATQAGRQGAESLTRGIEEMNRLNRQAMDAFMQSASAMTRHFEEMGEHLSNLARVQLDDGVQTMQHMARANSLQEVMEAQNHFARSMFDRYLDYFLKMSDVGLRATEDSLAPLNAQWRQNVEQMEEQGQGGSSRQRGNGKSQQQGASPGA